jgi:methyltransferase (TIGR00027 family)
LTYRQELGTRASEGLNDTVLTGVPKTALGVARIRAGESKRPDRLFDDPYAAAFVAAMPDAFPTDASRSDDAKRVGARIAMHVVVRTRFYDDYLLAAAADGIRQVVLLAAGLDTRAFRLPWPDGTTVFEVDLPEMLAFKEQVLSGRGSRPSSNRTAVAADLTADWSAAMSTSGFDPRQPTAWLIEGLLVYLTYDDAARLLDAVADLSVPGSRLSCEQGRSAMQLAAQSADGGASEATKLWQGGIEDIPGWLAEHDWSVETFDLAGLAANYGRPISTETQTGFVLARR